MELENVTFDELQIGQTASITRTLFEKDIELFAILSGDYNPAHLDEAYAKQNIFGGIIGHGMWSGALISSLLGTVLPGPGTIYLNQNLDFKKPVRLGETVTITITVKEKRPPKNVVVFDCQCLNNLGEVAISGSAIVIAPATKIRCERPDLPDINLRYNDRYRAIINECASLAPCRTAIVHPVTADALLAVIEAQDEKLIEPILIGPEDKIKNAAKEANLEISNYRLVATEHSHAAAAKAVELAVDREVNAIMKGSISTDELMSVVVRTKPGLHTDRRISHCYVMDVPTYHKLLIITDAAINISPTLEEKADICRNAIDLWSLIANDASKPKVAILAATEKINPNIQATIDAACLCKMAERDQISSALLDGPLALDLAISQEAVLTKNIVSSVAGDADILLAPDINSANMIAKQLTFLGGANAAGIVLGTKVPIILTSRADSVRTRLMSCALAVLVSDAYNKRFLK